MTIETVALASDLPSPGAAPRAVVMTMGALHEGHAALVRTARRAVGAAGTVIVTVFVNPTQFGVDEDFARYPRSLESDLETCSRAGADLLFAPGVVEVYGNADGFRVDSVTVDPGPPGEVLEGAYRPGHFRGMLTVVAKMIGLTRPDVALFGEKDFQQLVLIRRMVRDLSMPVDVVGVATVREPDGLARSSRNRYLSPDERRSAAAIPRALDAVRLALSDGVDVALGAGHAMLAAEPGVEIDYLVVTDDELGPPVPGGPGRVLVAARIGSTRLIDNVAVSVIP